MNRTEFKNVDEKIFNEYLNEYDGNVIEVHSPEQICGMDFITYYDFKLDTDDKVIAMFVGKGDDSEYVIRETITEVI